MIYSATGCGVSKIVVFQPCWSGIRSIRIQPACFKKPMQPLIEMWDAFISVAISLLSLTFTRLPFTSLNAADACRTSQSRTILAERRISSAKAVGMTSVLPDILSSCCYKIAHTALSVQELKAHTGLPFVPFLYLFFSFLLIYIVLCLHKGIIINPCSTVPFFGVSR
jgi:hypothetical protein